MDEGGPKSTDKESTRDAGEGTMPEEHENEKRTGTRATGHTIETYVFILSLFLILKGHYKKIWEL